VSSLVACLACSAVQAASVWKWRDANGRITVSDRNSASVASWDVMVSLGVGEYVELYWSSPDTTLLFPTVTGLTGPVRPGIPSLILTVQQVA